MESWNHIINTALLGTEKRAIKKEDFAGALAENTDVIYQFQTDKEDQFLQLASVVYNYRQCGVLPMHNETLSLSKADKEENKYCSPFSQSVLSDLLQLDSKPLLELWFNECIKKEMIVQPEMVPVLFDAATRYRHLQKEIVLCTGKRGTWLMQFNEDWKFKTISLDENLWQTGSLAERKSVLVEIRQSESEKGREWLQSVWSQENAATKTNLLEALEINLSKDDEPWLEALLTDKSTKVKEEALRLLKIIPNSKIVLQYWNIISASVQLKKGKGLLGIGSKTELDFHLTGIDDSIYKTGIEKLSNQKAFSDDEFILYQLIQNVPPHLWEEHFQ